RAILKLRKISERFANSTVRVSFALTVLSLRDKVFEVEIVRDGSAYRDGKRAEPVLRYTIIRRVNSSCCDEVPCFAQFCFHVFRDREASPPRGGHGSYARYVFNDGYLW